MTLTEIKAAVEGGKTVHWVSEIYRVVRDSLGQWMIVCRVNNSAIGLTWQDGVTLNGKESQFYCAD